MKHKQGIVPHVWFRAEAVDAAEFYCSVFPDSKIISKNLIKDTPAGDCQMFSFEIWGRRFEAICAESSVELNPSISMMVNFDPLFFQEHENPAAAAREKLQEIWKRLSDGGQALMELGKYDFSPLYGWIMDRHGMNWQLILTDPGGEPRPPIMPSMMFVKDNCGKAEEAGAFYRSLFSSSEAGMLVRYPAGMEPEIKGTVMFSDFKLGETWITAMESANKHEFQFNEAMSFMIFCEDQEEIDHFWNTLSAAPDAERCGWLKDKYGVSWQIVPEELTRMREAGSDTQNRAVTEALVGMKKIDIEKLRKAFEEAG